MLKELNKQEIEYKFEFSHDDHIKESRCLPEYENIYNKLNLALNIDKPGFNVYLIDDFSKDKLENLKEYIKTLLKNRSKPKDICYVIKDDDKSPVPMFLPNGMGKEFKETIEELQNIYLDCVYEFYNGNSDNEKEDIINEIQKKRSDLISKLIKTAEDDGFNMKTTNTGFTFIPMALGEMMSEKEFEELSVVEREGILEKVNKLKINAQGILEKLKNSELDEIEKLKVILQVTLKKSLEAKKREYADTFKDQEAVLEFLNNMCINIEKSLIDAYSFSYEDDEEDINNILSRNAVNVIVDNSNNEECPIIYEEDPSIANLLGSIEYENKNGTYVTDISLIKSGALLKANEGCLIIRMNSLISNSSAYYYLKKCLISSKVDLDYNRGYLEILSLNGLKPQPVPICEKVILIGDYESYSLLYNYDEDFKKIFKIRAEYEPIIEINDDTKISFISNITKLIEANNLNPIDHEAVIELAKFLSRKAENRKKMYLNDYEINRVVMQANNNAIMNNRQSIEGSDILNAAWEEEILEKEVLDGFKDKTILINIEDKKIGEINGLSVIDTGFMSFGKPIKITCNCYKGSGEVIDVQKSSDLSGSIHNKAINILKGYINKLNGGYEELPVDFHVSFEQIYGKVDGDSASIAEIISMISALSKIPIKQNIAVTGSVNQVGNVQPIGGVNEKIEGFYKVCRLLGNHKNKGVLIPYLNRDNIVLRKEIEQQVANGDFHIYTMDTVEDAIEALMCDDTIRVSDVFESIKKEIKKYGAKAKNKD
ncbi:AAA family ATPase [Clostridium sp. JN-9]|uniref:AAA family ATPase n=1 Tax=Clostridium sp. JN-9 TaxID=2507159 RepID=UPI000FFDF9DA|nr:AAA family ATPase [Clostridium sp. JN-9]QAT40001.1 ATP-dependent protease [Clostridium sp. JN-9]